ncbi:MAG: UTP--glucose-1-phosphate uridylyltransferase [Chlamydiales bacterium]
MLKGQIFDYLTSIGQRQLSAGIDQLSSTQLESFFAQLKKHDALLLKRQREALFRTRPLPSAIEPLTLFENSGHVESRTVGMELLSKGKVGCLFLAGGQGSRLGVKGPKGLVPVTPILRKPLFQLLLEKSVAAAKQAGHTLPVAIMTSPLNHIETISFLEKQRYFGLKEQNCSFFVQGMLPHLDNRGDWLLESPGRLAEGADGNGGALINFFNSGIWAKWKERGVEYLNIIPIDNALGDPFDAEQIGACHLSQADAVLKGITRLHKDEQLGVVGLVQGHVCIIEYTELPEQEKNAADVDGTLRWKIANSGLFSFRMDFIERLAKDPHFFLPWHVAKKSSEILLMNSKGSFQETVKIWKCETFLFDVLNFTTRAKVLVYPRDEVYAPLKNATGPNSLDEVQAALEQADRRAFKKVTGRELPKGKFELDPAFYYPTADLIEKWRGREPVPGYVEA